MRDARHWAAEVYVWDCGRHFLAVQNNWKNGTDHSEMDYYHTAGYDGATVNAVVEAAGGHAVAVDPGGSLPRKKRQILFGTMDKRRAQTVLVPAELRTALFHGALRI